LVETVTKEKKIYTGRRKTSVARVMLLEGSGKIQINKKDLKEYFNLEVHQEAVKQPLLATNTLNKYDVIVNVRGGGQTGQADAIKLAIARALVNANPQF